VAHLFGQLEKLAQVCWQEWLKLSADMDQVSGLHAEDCDSARHRPLDRRLGEPTHDCA